MTHDWQKLTEITGGTALTIEQVRLSGKDIVVQGSFELPPLAQLSLEDQVFVAAFIHSHGSIKEMERLFGVSYPTVKNRLNRIGGSLKFLAADAVAPEADPLSLLARGEINVSEALEQLKRRPR